jgi:hypothetical protein
MGDWSQKADADNSKSMSDRPAGSAVEPCPADRKIESIFVPPESVDVAARIEVAEEPGVVTRHAAEPDSSIQTAHSTVDSDES